MASRLAVAGLAVCVAASGACARGGGKKEGGRSLLTPKFKPDPEAGGTGSTVATTSTTAPGESTTTVRGARGSTTTTAAGAGSDGGGLALLPPSATINDKTGDLTTSLDPPPAYADLVGATLTKRPEGFELRVALGGGSAPSTIDEDHTMNVASFYDVDGDGSIDFEVWANLASTGWGASYFDNKGGRSTFQQASGVTVGAEGGDVVLRFPLSHLGYAERFRWSIASEWGRYEVLGSPATARDDAPDNDGAARFPG